MPKSKRKKPAGMHKMPDGTMMHDADMPMPKRKKSKKSKPRRPAY